MTFPRSMNTLVFDSNHLLYQSAWGAKVGSEPGWGSPATGMALGTIRSLLFRFHPQRVIFVWDSGKLSSRRVSLYPEYKQKKGKGSEENRVGLSKTIRMLVPLLRRLGCRCAVVPGKEADDVIAWFARYFQGEMTLVAEDRDFYQLLSSGVLIYHGRTDRMVSAQYFEDEVPLAQYLLYRAIVGDTSDNIKGVPGAGKVTASKWLNGHPEAKSVESLRESLEGAGKLTKRVGRVLAHLDVVARNLRLMGLDEETFSEVEEAGLQASVEKPVGFDETVREELTALGLHRLAAEFDNWSLPFKTLG